MSTIHATDIVYATITRMGGRMLPPYASAG